MDEAAIKKLRRGALEPARVFARRDFDPNSAAPLWHFIGPAGEDYWSPGYPTWLIADGDCRVLERALQRYGSKEAPTAGPLPDSWFNGQGTLVTLEGPDYYEMRNGTVVPFYRVFTNSGNEEALVAATPVAYCSRRFGDDLTFVLDGDRVKIGHGGKVVAVVRTHNITDLGKAA